MTFGVASGRTGKWLVLGFFLVFTFVPLLWLVISSFKTNLELTTRPFALPEVWQLQNYVTAFRIAGCSACSATASSSRSRPRRSPCW